MADFNPYPRQAVPALSNPREAVSAQNFYFVNQSSHQTQIPLNYQSITKHFHLINII